MPWQLIGGDTCSESSVGEDSSQSEDEGEGDVAKKKGKASRGKEREDQLAKLLKVESGGIFVDLLSFLEPITLTLCFYFSLVPQHSTSEEAGSGSLPSSGSSQRRPRETDC